MKLKKVKKTSEIIIVFLHFLKPEQPWLEV